MISYLSDFVAEAGSLLRIVVIIVVIAGLEKQQGHLK